MLVFGARQVVGGLQIQPESRIDVKKAAEANGRVGGNVAPPADDVADTVAGDANGLRQGVRGEAEGLQIFLGENLAGMRAQAGHGKAYRKSFLGRPDCRITASSVPGLMSSPGRCVETVMSRTSPAIMAR